MGFKDGHIKIYDKDLNQKHGHKAAKDCISDMKFSPDGQTLAVGSHDNMIYIFGIADAKQKCKPMRKHSSYITHIDFSCDGNTLHSNCGAYELIFWDLAQNGKQVTLGATMFRDEKWATWTCTLGWPVQGIWPECSDGTDINACDRSHQTYSCSE